MTSNPSRWDVSSQTPFHVSSPSKQQTIDPKNETTHGRHLKMIPSIPRQNETWCKHGSEFHPTTLDFITCYSYFIRMPLVQQKHGNFMKIASLKYLKWQLQQRAARHIHDATVDLRLQRNKVFSFKSGSIFLYLFFPYPSDPLFSWGGKCSSQS